MKRPARNARDGRPFLWEAQESADGTRREGRKRPTHAALCAEIGAGPGRSRRTVASAGAAGGLPPHPVMGRLRRIKYLAKVFQTRRKPPSRRATPSAMQSALQHALRSGYCPGRTLDDTVRRSRSRAAERAPGTLGAKRTKRARATCRHSRSPVISGRAHHWPLRPYDEGAPARAPFP